MQFKIFIICLLVFINTKIFGQLNLSAVAGELDAYKVTYMINGSLANLGETSSMFTRSSPGYIVWFEYGDGKFTFQPKIKHNYNISNPKAFLRLAGVYEGGNKPTRIIQNPNFNPTSENNATYEANDNLSSGYNVKITSSVPAIRANDTMTYAIDYQKPKDASGWKLVFEYNLDRISYFKQTTGFNYFVDQMNPSIHLPFIRTHNNENIQVATNQITFDLNTIVSNKSTVFISLATFKDLPEEEGYGAVIAYLVPPRGSEFENSKSNKDVNSLRNIGDKPHDPNWIKVDKRCLKPSTVNTVLNYHIHFQNTGTGAANDVVVIAAKLPKNINANSLSIVTNNFSANYGGVQLNTFQPYVHDPIVTYDHSIATIHNAHSSTTTPGGSSTITNYFINSVSTVGTCFYDFTSHTDSIFFMVVHPGISDRTILHGMNVAKPNFINDPLTMGDIKFKVTLGAYAAPDSLEMIAQIVFDGEHPVYTEEESIKVKRKCKKRQEAPCNCNSGRKRNFWQWLKERCQ